MDRQNLISRLVDRKLQTARNARPICVCMFAKVVCISTAGKQPPRQAK